MKTMQIKFLLDFTRDISGNEHFAQNIDWPLIYASLMLATNLICTLLIVYRIVRFAHRLLLFRSVISAVIESSGIFTLASIVFLALVGRNTIAAFYADIVVAYVKVKTSLFIKSCSMADCFLVIWQAIAPMLLVLCVAAMPTSSEDTNSEMTASRDLLIIHFTPLDENSCDNVSDGSIPVSHYRTDTTEIV